MGPRRPPSPEAASEPIAARCDLRIATGAGPDLLPGQPLPPDLRVIVTRADIDGRKLAWAIDDQGTRSMHIVLQGAAVDRFAAETAGHVGENLAIAIDGTVVAVPTILSAIDGGEIEISGSPTNQAIDTLFPRCIIGA